MTTTSSSSSPKAYQSVYASRFGDWRSRAAERLATFDATGPKDASNSLTSSLGPARTSPQSDRLSPQSNRPSPQSDRPSPQSDRPSPQSDRLSSQSFRSSPQLGRTSAQPQRTFTEPEPTSPQSLLASAESQPKSAHSRRTSSFSHRTSPQSTSTTPESPGTSPRSPPWSMSSVGHPSYLLKNSMSSCPTRPDDAAARDSTYFSSPVKGSSSTAFKGTTSSTVKCLATTSNGSSSSANKGSSSSVVTRLSATSPKRVPSSPVETFTSPAIKSSSSPIDAVSPVPAICSAPPPIKSVPLDQEQNPDLSISWPSPGLRSSYHRNPSSDAISAPIRRSASSVATGRVAFQPLSHAAADLPKKFRFIIPEDPVSDLPSAGSVGARVALWARRLEEEKKKEAVVLSPLRRRKLRHQTQPITLQEVLSAARLDVEPWGAADDVSSHHTAGEEGEDAAGGVRGILKRDGSRESWDCPRSILKLSSPSPLTQDFPVVPTPSFPQITDTPTRGILKQMDGVWGPCSPKRTVVSPQAPPVWGRQLRGVLKKESSLEDGREIRSILKPQSDFVRHSSDSSSDDQGGALQGGALPPSGPVDRQGSPDPADLPPRILLNASGTHLAGKEDLGAALRHIESLARERRAPALPSAPLP
ncbi:flocculation protein FLO11 [Hyalella azteca]|uniref:Flocculation protein FLO11 n=1 Tax=Hyalella azteca TaxID=294128 RepID=A0A8B7P2G9_HYAAZ|nr:flocculation protein FLO11 [Hyalella azteca]